MTILKRSVFIIISKTTIYWPLPSAVPQKVPCKTWLLDIIKEESKHILSNYKKSGPIPKDHDARVLWEKAWLNEAIRQHEPHTEETNLNAVPSPTVRVKGDRLVWSLSLSSEPPISLETPSPSPKKRARGSSDSPNDIPNPDFGSEAEQDSMEEELARLVEMQENGDAMDVASHSN